MKDFVFSEQSLPVFASSLTQDMVESKNFKSDKDYINISFDSFEIFFTDNMKDKHFPKLPLIIFQSEQCCLSSFNQKQMSDIFIETYRVAAKLFQRKGTDVYSPSIVYSKNNLIALAVLDKYHLFMVVNYQQSGNIVVFRITSDKKEKIQDFLPNSSAYQILINSQAQIDIKYKESLEEKEILNVKDSYNFNVTYNDEKQYKYTYEEWIQILSKSQKNFLDNTSKKAIRLKGPAGTGKTLVMELKAIKILKENPNVKILFTCHSWPVAFNVSDFFDRVAPDVLDRIEILPLMAIAQDSIKAYFTDVKVLGDDSFSGKQEQIRILKSIIDSFIDNDWTILKQKCSEHFVKEFEETRSGNNNFIWDIMIEIACVIGANGIMPGRHQAEKYKQIERRPWMLHLESDGEKNVIFNIYTKFMECLRENGQITSDQIINDYVRSLTTYNWFYERKDKGFDYIFVDEMQLFNAQECMALLYLSRDPDENPRIYMAMDPKQSVEGVYGDLGVTNIIRKTDPGVEKSLKSSDFHLDMAYRYSEEILAFLKHIDTFYPTLNFEDYWNNKIQKVASDKKKIGKSVDIYFEANLDEVVTHAIELCESSRTVGVQCCILSLDDESFTAFMNKDNKTSHLKIVNSMRDTNVLPYIKSRIVVSRPSYIIGLQFDFVVIVGFEVNYDSNSPNYTYYERRFLSDLYLGASRAKSKLVFISNRSGNNFPKILETAITEKILEKK